tara:strand:- start:540 stop:770 length:231 start_codon:yes stop_codon:yes gene_type:complete
MADRPFTPVIIGLIVGFLIAAAGSAYFLVFRMIPGGWVGQAVVLALTLLFLALIVVVVRRRLIEIEEEDPDDYRKY